MTTKVGVSVSAVAKVCGFAPPLIKYCSMKIKIQNRKTKHEHKGKARKLKQVVYQYRQNKHKV